MPQTVPVMLPVPRVVTAVKRRVRSPEPERLCVLDEVPVLVRAVAGAEAPVALRSDSESYRAFEGALYRPLFGQGGSGCRPAEAAAVIRARASYAAGTDHQDHPWRQKGERVVNVKGAFKGAKVERGLRTFEGHQVGVVHDDGLAAQRVMADEAGANLLLVDDTLWHRAPCPEYAIEATGRLLDPDHDTCRISVHRNNHHHTYVGYEGRVRPLKVEDFHEAPWMRFMPHEAEKAAAYATALGQEPWHGLGAILPGGVKEFEVTDPVAYAAAVSVRGAGVVLADGTEYLLRAVADRVGLMADEDIDAYQGARRAMAALRAGADPDEAWERIALFVDAVEEFHEPYAHGRRHSEDDEQGIDYYKASDAVYSARSMRIRYERFESPRPHLYAQAAPEIEAIAGLAR